MKKLNVSSYAMRTKWIVILLCVVFLLVFGRTVNSPALTKTAIVIGIGVDFDEKTSEFEITTQAVQMLSNTSGTGGQRYDVTTCRGKTISSALDDISQKMGLIVSLAHCEVLFLSKSALKLDHLQIIYPLNTMYALREQAIIVTGSLSPREMLATRIGTTISSPYFLQSAIVNNEGTDGLIKTTAKDLLARSMSRSEATAIPYILPKKLEDQPQNEQEEMKDNYEFDLSRVLVFNHDSSEILDEDLSEILAIFLSETTYGSLNYTAENGSSFEFRILDKGVKTSANGRTIKAEIDLKVDLLDYQFVQTDEILSGATEIIREAAKKLGEQLTDRMKKLHALSLQYGIDFLGLQAKAYQRIGRKLEEHCLDSLSFSPKVKITVKEAA